MYSPSRILLHISMFFDGDKDRELFSWCSRRRESSSGVCVGAVLILVPLGYHLLAAKHYQIFNYFSADSTWLLAIFASLRSTFQSCRNHRVPLLRLLDDEISAHGQCLFLV